MTSFRRRTPERRLTGSGEDKSYQGIGHFCFSFGLWTGQATGRLVFENVAVEHPIAGIVGDEGDLDLLARRNQRRVLPFALLESILRK